MQTRFFIRSSFLKLPGFSFVAIVSSRFTRRFRALTGITLLAFVGMPGRAAQTPDLTQKSLEDLMNIEVTSISKREQKTSQAAGAVFVISREDIGHSGALNIPDLLRMVPGLDVAQIDAGKWAISARGFNGQYSNKLLVLVDGRTVYSPIFAGVFWDSQNVPLDTIERIEVIRGPGAAVWGSNAMNGVINIITRSAGDAQAAMLPQALAASVPDRRPLVTAAAFAASERIASMRKDSTTTACPPSVDSMARTTRASSMVGFAPTPPSLQRIP
jgi:outer membrane cobalamin receptor